MAPGTRSASNAASNDGIYSSIEEHLHTVTAPFGKRIEDIEKKIASRRVVLNQHSEHRRNGTLPKGFVAPRMPQIPATMANEFREKFDSLAEKFTKDVLDVAIVLRNKEVNQLQAEKDQIVKDTKEKVHEALTYAAGLLDDLQPSGIPSLVQRYMTSFLNQLQEQKRDNDVASVFKDFVTREKKAADLLKNAAAKADEVEAPEGVDRLRKEVHSMKKEIAALRSGKAKDTPKGNKKPSREGAKAPKTPKAPKPGKGKSNAGPSKKNKSKNGQGAPERGAKAN